MKAGPAFNPNKDNYMGPGKISPTNKPLLGDAADSGTIGKAFKLSRSRVDYETRHFANGKASKSTGRQ